MSDVDTRDGSSTGVFNLVFIGWFWAITAIVVPTLLVGCVLEVFSNPSEAARALGFAVLVPLIAAVQGLVVGIFVVFGLWVRRVCGDRLALLRGKRPA